MNETIRLILSLSISGSIIALLLFSAKPLIKHKLPQTIQYYIWIVVLLRLLIPFSFEWSLMNHVFSVDYTSKDMGLKQISQPMKEINEEITNENIINGDISVSDQAAYEVQNERNNIHNEADHRDKHLSISPDLYVLFLWILGMIVVFGVNVTGYVRFLRLIKKWNRPADEREKAILESITCSRYKVGLVRNSFIDTPMLIGILQPEIIIPDIDFDESQLKNILLHEITHYKHFDIAIKWLAMIAASIHWFNPLVYFVRKEINRACELACDETVVRNLDAEGKQAYGDTLISVASEREYSSGVIQATMCEEKRSLKERLVSIMKYSPKSRMIMIISVMLLVTAVIGAAALGASVGGFNSDDKPPIIYISAEGIETKTTVTGTNNWKAQSDFPHPLHLEYNTDNIVDLGRGQQMTIGTQKLRLDKKYKFSLEDISVFKNQELIELEVPEPFYTNGTLYMQAPSEEGEYTYSITLNFTNSKTVNYGFIVRVMDFNLKEIANHKTPYIGNNVKVQGIVANLPLPNDNFAQRYISLGTDRKPFTLSVFYEVKTDTLDGREWSELSSDRNAANMKKNALVLFCMIDNLEEVVFAFRNSKSEGTLNESKYSEAFSFKRNSFRDKYGDLNALGNDLKLLEEALVKEPQEGMPEHFKVKLVDFSDEEVEAARSVVYEYFRAIAAKDREAILKTFTDEYNRPNAVLFGEETLKLSDVDYDPDDPMRLSYVMHGRGSIKGTQKEDVIVFKVRFNVEYPNGAAPGSFNEGEYTGWHIILVREYPGAPWLIDDQGY
ncbi:MAG: DUF4829 domain-containing protein [Clostridiaceae bacterium]|nr:DUF4829 domain-containing protein [Clostridiaceae bacterium]